MADQRILYSEEMVGANHATKADTLNRLTVVDHEQNGGHKSDANATLSGAPILLVVHNSAGAPYYGKLYPTKA